MLALEFEVLKTKSAERRHLIEVGVIFYVGYLALVENNSLVFVEEETKSQLEHGYPFTYRNLLEEQTRVITVAKRNFSFDADKYAHGGDIINNILYFHGEPLDLRRWTGVDGILPSLPSEFLLRYIGHYMYGDLFKNALLNQ